MGTSPILDPPLALNKDLTMALSIPSTLLVIEAPVPGRSLIVTLITYIDYANWTPPQFIPPKEEEKRRISRSQKKQFRRIIKKNQGLHQFRFLPSRSFIQKYC